MKWVNKRTLAVLLGIIVAIIIILTTDVLAAKNVLLEKHSNPIQKTGFNMPKL